MKIVKPFLENVTKTLVNLMSSCLLLTLVCGCSSDPDLDMSLMTDTLCTAPCWHNITPGLSDEDDVRDQLENSPFVKEGTLKYDSTNLAGEPTGILYWLARGREPNRVYLRDGKVVLIEIQLDYDLTLGEIVDKYGNPERIFACVDGADRIVYTVILRYPTQGLTFVVYHQVSPYDDIHFERGKGELDQDIVLTKVFYYAPTSLEDVLSDLLLLSPDTVKYYLENSHKWQGFGLIDLAD